MFKTAHEWLNLSKTLNEPLYQLVIDREIEASDKTYDDIINYTKHCLKIMKTSANKALETPQKTIGNMISGDSKRLYDYHKSGKAMVGNLVSKAMARALSSSEVNASMGLICAAPTAGACGILPAALITVGEHVNASDDHLIKALMIATGIGIIITENATLSGAEGGCQAECGSAAAMAAGAVVYLQNGSNEMIFDAAAIAIKNIMGLICDPIAGIVESPCAKRNANGVVNAISSADMALAGIKSIVPFDEVVESMAKVGKLLPFSLKETALGGIATTSTGICIRKRIFGE